MRLMYEEVVPLVGVQRRVICWANAHLLRISIEQIGVYLVDQHTSAIQQLACYTQDESQLVEALLGPPLLLALALRDIFCLHASAVQYQERAILFLGESGQGKSTLARLLSEYQPQQFRRLADDIVPVSFTTRLNARLRFPQLKLDRQAQPGVQFQSEIPIGAICILGSPTPTVSITRNHAAQALLPLIRHTVAARLFPASLAKKQMSCLAQSTAPVFQLHYLREITTLPRLAQLLCQMI
ncbi:MAG: hypothetical protein ACPG8W_07255 [Candidatus Promineifilaceae bacterium]